MKKELLELGFTEEQVENIVKVVGKNNVSLDRFNEVNETKKQLEKDVKERDKQLEELKKNNKDNEELKSQITALQESNKKAEEAYQAEISKIKLDNAVNNALNSAKAKNIKAVKALLNLENLQILEYLKHTDANGIQRDLTLATLNERAVLIDDSMPTEAVTDSQGNYTKYTTYVLGQGAFEFTNPGARVSFEMDRNPAKNGGEDTFTSC